MRPIATPNPVIRTAFLLLLAASMHASAVPPGLPDTADAIDSVSIEGQLGFAPGERHPFHHELMGLYRTLADASPRMALEVVGRSHGGREQALLYFATPERLERLEEIRAGRVDASRQGEGPPVVWLGYSVHGNEASGASAAAVMAWYLALSDDERVRRWLDELVIVMEPVINPDGVDRFAHWVNMHRGRNPSADPADREHNEGWPNGRTSYYWFDLNRDWLPLTHPVSRQRIAHYRQWRPHVLTDVHEMGSRATYFFQPGVPERNNPATPQRVFELTRKIAAYHGGTLDAAGEAYYTRESFDDYYLGKGSTYPDVTGGVGILFEQGSARGHRMDTPYGERTFAEAIANQVRTTISTLEASVDLSDDLIDHQREFFAEAREMADQGGWLLGDDGDPGRARRLLEILLGHGIDVRPVAEPVRIDGADYAPGAAWAIPADQDHYRFIRAIFSTPTALPMETFYDVSAWPLQHAFALPLAEVRRLPPTGEPLTAAPAAPGDELRIDGDAVAWIVPWNQHRAPAVLAALLADGYRVQAAERALEMDIAGEPRRYGRGSLIIHRGIQPEAAAPVHEALQSALRRYGVQAVDVTSGLARSGIDLGSPSAPVLESPKPLLVTGDGVDPYGAGYVWRWFDIHLDRPLTRVDAGELAGVLDEDYTHVILAPGRYDDELGARLAAFVDAGGQLVALGDSAEWVESLDLGWAFADTGDDEEAQPAPEDDDSDRRYADHDLDYARRIIGGSALAVEIDPTHPLLFGYADETLTMFRQGAHVLAKSANRYATPAHYAEEPLVAGYLSEHVRDMLAGTTALAADRFGPGLVVRIADDTLFRGYWAGSERVFANALFFGQLIEATRLPE